MVKIKVNDNWNKVNTKDELLELLDRYRGILRDSMLKYLESLIKLKYSVVREKNIDYDDVRSLSELEIYKEVAIYNIYNRALNLFNGQNRELIISGNNYGFENLNVLIKINDKFIKLFNFDYSDHLRYDDHIPSGFKSMKIGVISLYQSLENQELREIELSRVMNELEKLYNEQNPYLSQSGEYGGPSSKWFYEHNQKIAKYEKIFKELDNKEKLSDDEKKEIEVTNQFHDLLLKDYGLADRFFYEEDYKSNAEESVLQKTLVRKQTNLTIVNNIKYM